MSTMSELQQVLRLVRKKQNKRDRKLSYYGVFTWIKKLRNVFRETEGRRK